MAGFSREVARRIFAEELRSSNLSFRDGEEQHQYAPQFLLTPTGARCNRVFLAGTLTEKDDIGGETEYWRGRVVDPTGSILIYAGQYQPEAAQKLASIEPPAFVVVVGKPNLYQTEDGNLIVSIRAEAIQRVDESTRNRWILDTARHTYDRLKALESATKSPLSSEFSTADKAALLPATDIDRARLHYGTEIEQYKNMALRALDSLRADLNRGKEVESIAVEVIDANEAAAEIDGPGAVKANAVLPETPQKTAAGHAKSIPDSSKKAKPRASAAKEASLSTFPDQGEKEDVETIPMYKKS